LCVNTNVSVTPVCDTAVVCNKASTCHNVAVLEPVVHAGLGLFDPDDRMYSPRLFRKLTKLLGVVPTIDAAASSNGENAFCPTYCSPDNSFLHWKPDRTNHVVWLNPPFSRAAEFVDHFLQLKSVDGSLSGIIVVPVLKDNSVIESLEAHGCKLVTHHTKGAKLFTQLSDFDGSRVSTPPCPFEVKVFYSPPVITSVVNTTTEVQTDRCKSSFSANIQTIHNY